jgi:hypothetical protein
LSTPVDYNPEKIKILLKRLEDGTLERDDARDLMSSLRVELTKARKRGLVEGEADIAMLMDILNSYAKGRINLRVPPEVQVHVA